ADLGVAQFSFGLAFELGFGQFDRNDGGQTFANVLIGEVIVFIAQEMFIAGVPVDQRSQCTAEAFFVGTTLVGVDGVGIGVYRFGVCGGPLHGHFNGHAKIGVFLLEGNDVVVDNFGALGFIEMGDIVQQTVFVEVVHHTNSIFGGFGGFVTISLDFGFCISQGFAVGFSSNFVGVGRFLNDFTFIGERDAQAFIQKGHLLEARADRFEIKVGGFKDFWIRVEGLRRPGFIGGTDFL